MRVVSSTRYAPARDGALRRRDRGWRADRDGGREGAQRAGPLRGPPRAVHDRSREREHRGHDPQLPAHLPRPRLRADGEEIAGAVARARGRGRHGADARRRRARRRRRHRVVGAGPRGGRRTLRAALGRRGRRAMADAPVPTGIELRVPARRGDPPFPRGRPGAGPPGGEARGRAPRGDRRRVDHAGRRRRGGERLRRRDDPRSGGDRRSRCVGGSPPRSGGLSARPATDPGAVHVPLRGRAAISRP